MVAITAGQGARARTGGSRLAGLVIGAALGVVIGVATGTGQSSLSVDYHVGPDGQTLLPRVPDGLSADIATVIVAPRKVLNRCATVLNIVRFR